MIKAKIWDQARNGGTMAIRISTVQEVVKLAVSCTRASAKGGWTSLSDYLQNSQAAVVQPNPYTRNIDVLWLRQGLGIPPWSHCQQRRFQVTYTGRQRTKGGFASQAYVVLDPAWDALIRPFNMQDIRVAYVSWAQRDLLVVLR